MQVVLDILALTSGWELVAVALAIAYVLLAIQQSLWCWPAAALSASIYTALFVQSGLLMESLLQVFYIVMAGYGYWQWTHARKAPKVDTQTHTSNTLPITTRSIAWHMRWLAALSLLSMVVAWLLAQYSRADMVWLDTPTTVFSLFATYLVARKVLENWLYWVAIDVCYVALFWLKGFYPTAILFAIYTVMAMIGYIKWRRDLSEQASVGEASVNRIS